MIRDAYGYAVTADAIAAARLFDLEDAVCANAAVTTVCGARCVLSMIRCARAGAR